MSVALGQNYASALSDADDRGVRAKVSDLESLLQRTVGTINVDAKLLRNMAYSQNYMSYYKSLSLGLRKIAEARFHSHRAAVDEKVHPGYTADIVNAALSPDGRGLTNYGSVTLELEEASIVDRVSVMRENAFRFYERYDLGRRDAEEQAGWRSTWTDRSRLGVAHLASLLTPATPTHRLPDLILFSGTDRHDDHYMEAHI